MLIGLCAGALITLLYLFLICPHIGKKPMHDDAFRVHYAHRGLHDDDVPENTLTAFKQAMEHGYGIELDVRMTQDKQLVVFHDATLTRMCGTDEHVEDMTLAQIKELPLLETSESIPTLSEVLALIDGCVPLMIEMKAPFSFKHDPTLPKTLGQMLNGYLGPVCVESFDPRLVRYFKKHMPHVPRGQLAQKSKGMGAWALSQLLCNFLSRPHFIAYEKGRQTTSLKIARLFHPVLVAWTIHSTTEWQAVQHTFDLMVFEAFLPPADKTARPFQKEGNLP